MNPAGKRAVIDAITEASREVTDGAGRQIRAIGDEAVRSISKRWSVPARDIYIAALHREIYPRRYLRNRDVINTGEQIRLAEATVAVAGAGGLGGHVIQLLARVGVGRLVVADHDVFDETNLNRQILSSSEAVGQSKVSAVTASVAGINCGVDLTCFREKITEATAAGIIRGCDVVVDALDTVRDRFILEAASREEGIPLVHGALAGFEGRVMTIFPGDGGLKLLYGDGDEGEGGAEQLLGVPSLTPAIIASLQAMEVVKIIVGRGSPFRDMMIYVDLEKGSMERFRF